jgi:hypothetical protein
MNAKRKFAILEWGVVLVPSLAVVVLTNVIGLNALWKDGVVYTVVLFAAIVSVERSAWRRTVFWTSLALVLCAHTLILFSLLQMLAPNRFGMPKLLLIPFAVVEGVFILAILRKRMKAVEIARGVLDSSKDS